MADIPLMENPMTTGGDVIYGGASGAPARLANGTVGKVLTSGGTTVPPTWETPAASGAVATDAIWDAAGDLVQGTGANTAARLAIGTAGFQLRSTGTAAAWVADSVVQIKTANLASDHSTTAATLQDAGLSLAFTPLFADSILHVIVEGECVVSRVAGTLVERFQWVSITNDTDAVEIVRQVRGGRVTSSADLGSHFNSIGLKGFYTVNSLTARTFKLQHMAGVVTNLESTISGGRLGGVTMTITEVRP